MAEFNVKWLMITHFFEQHLGSSQQSNKCKFKPHLFDSYAVTGALVSFVLCIDFCIDNITIWLAFSLLLCFIIFFCRK